MDTQPSYQMFLAKLKNMSEKELYETISNSVSTISKEQFFSLCFYCRKVNYELFPIFYITLTRMFPLLSLNEHIHNFTWLPSFSWNDYLRIVEVLLERNLTEDTFADAKAGFLGHSPRKDKDSIYNRLCNTIINIIAEQIYTERYYIINVSTLALHLPREKKNMDKKTKIVRKLAYAYYKLYQIRNKPLNEWENVNINVKNKSLQLYRKDVAEISRIAKEQKATDFFIY